jgi:hypothetical protein
MQNKKNSFYALKLNCSLIKPVTWTYDIHNSTIFHYSYMFRHITLPSSGINTPNYNFLKYSRLYEAFRRLIRSTLNRYLCVNSLVMQSYIPKYVALLKSCNIVYIIEACIWFHIRTNQKRNFCLNYISTVAVTHLQEGVEPCRKIPVD